jgi:hypothetical protein
MEPPIKSTTKFFYAEAVNLTIGKEYCLKGLAKGVIVKIVRKDGRLVQREGSTVRTDEVEELLLQKPDGQTILGCPKLPPEKECLRILSENRGTWRHRYRWEGD